MNSIKIIPTSDGVTIRVEDEMDAGQQATENALNDAAKKEEARIKEEEAKKKLADEAAAAKKPVVLTKEQEAHKKRVDECGKKVQDILKQYHGLESNIPINHEYWGLQNNLRALHNEPV